MALIKLCDICGHEYEARHSKQRYCNECRDEAKRRRQRISTHPRFDLPPVGKVDFVRKEITSAKDGTRLVAMADHHYPFVDERTWGAVRRFLDEFQPNVIAWGGDVGDCYSVSVFDKNPGKTWKSKDEVRGLRNFLYTHRNRWPDAEHYYLKGNHEYRWDIRIKKDPDLEGLVSLENLLALKEMDFTVLPYGGVLDYLGFAITHGIRYSSLPNGTARMHAQNIGGSGVVFHSHRRGMWVYTDMRGTHTFYEGGCLCRLDPDYVLLRPPNWQQGFMVGVVYRQRLHLHQVAIYEDGFAVQGQFYRR